MMLTLVRFVLDIYYTESRPFSVNTFEIVRVLFLAFIPSLHVRDHIHITIYGALFSFSERL